MFKGSIPPDYSGTNEALKHTDFEHVIMKRAFTFTKDNNLVADQITALAAEVDDLRRDVTELQRRTAISLYSQIANALKNRLDIALEQQEFFNTEERQLKEYSMGDYHLMFVNYNKHKRGEQGEELSRFTQKQAHVYAKILSDAFPERFGCQRMLFEQLSYKVAYLVSGILEYAGGSAHHGSLTDAQVELEVNRSMLVDDDMKNPAFKAKDVKDLFQALKVVNHEVVPGAPLLEIQPINYPQLAYSRTEFDE